MNKKKFLEELEERLIGVSEKDRKGILEDYEEHFNVGKKDKRSEDEIADSLGNPKEIAKEIRKELSGNEKEELKSEAIETWVGLKKFSRHAFRESKEKVSYAYHIFNPRVWSHWVLLILIIIALATIVSLIGPELLFLLAILILIIVVDKVARKESISKSKVKIRNRQKGNGWRVALVILLNVLISIWIWLALFLVSIALFATGIGLIVSGVLLIVYSIFSMINYGNPLLTDLFLSALFSGFGIIILGVLITDLSDKLIKLFFKLTRKYLGFNRRLMRK